MKKFGLYLLPVFLLILGLPLLLSISNFIKSAQAAIVVTLVGFVLLNIIFARLLKLEPQLKNAWSTKRVWHILPGFLIGVIPMVVALIDLSLSGEDLRFKPLSMLTAFLTLATVAWEEAWFRGVPLELASKLYSKIGSAFVFGFVFSLLHLMNPKIDFLQDGLQLWLAGYTLSLCYFCFESIWAPIGMHFANNIIQSLFGMASEPRTWSYYLPLIIITSVFTIAVLKFKKVR